jgi:TPR repeat protein
MKKCIAIFFAIVFSNAIALSDEEVKLYEMLADFGDANAQLALGVHHIERFNNEEAMKWTLRAAESGLVSAQNNLGYLFQNGRAPGGVDFQKAFEWYLKAAELGSKTAQYNVCSIYYSGDQGVTRHLRKAKEWCQKSADQGYGGAQDLLKYIISGDVHWAN